MAACHSAAGGASYCCGPTWLMTCPGGAVCRLAYLSSPGLLVCAACVSGFLEALTPLSIISGAIMLFQAMQHTKVRPGRFWIYNQSSTTPLAMGPWVPDTMGSRGHLTHAPLIRRGHIRPESRPQNHKDKPAAAHKCNTKGSAKHTDMCRLPGPPLPPLPPSSVYPG